ncbi:hypothetical protein B0H12DRAFT_1246118 [Mycena haematopus]|nr:hypothetical protein B0H12DRAFT_1246118 [Mycena haematopus]
MPGHMPIDPTHGGPLSVINRVMPVAPERPRFRRFGRAIFGGTVMNQRTMLYYDKPTYILVFEVTIVTIEFSQLKQLPHPTTQCPTPLPLLLLANPKTLKPETKTNNNVLLVSDYPPRMRIFSLASAHFVSRQYLAMIQLARVRAALYNQSVDAQITAHLSRSLYSEKPGMAYFNLNLNLQTGILMPKCGRTANLTRRRNGYKKCETSEQEIIWAVAYQCNEPKRVERLVHLRLRLLDAELVLPPCLGCSARHKEFADYGKCGGIDGMKDIIENVLRDLGQPVVMYDLPLASATLS